MGCTASTAGPDGTDRRQAERGGPRAESFLTSRSGVEAARRGRPVIGKNGRCRALAACVTQATFLGQRFGVELSESELGARCSRSSASRKQRAAAAPPVQDPEAIRGFFNNTSPRGSPRFVSKLVGAIERSLVPGRVRSVRKQPCRSYGPRGIAAAPAQGRAMRTPMC